MRTAHVVVAQILGNAADESRKRLLRIKQVRNHRRGGGLAVRARHRYRPQFVRDVPQHLRALVYRHTDFFKILIFNKIPRHRRGIDHKIHQIGDFRHIAFKMDFRPFLPQHVSNRRRREVIAENTVTVLQEILRQRAHPDAADAQKVNVPIFHKSRKRFYGSWHALPPYCCRLWAWFRRIPCISNGWR